MSEQLSEKMSKSAERTLDLEIKDAQLIFNRVWTKLERERGVENLRFPREIFWLNGAPGAGKGTQTRFIMEYTGLTAKPILISDLLKSPEAVRLKDAGMMVGDGEVTELLMTELLKPERHTGVVIDGYPRTKVQVECLKLFYQRLMDLRRERLGTGDDRTVYKPVFHIVVLYVDEGVSVERQLKRGKKSLEVAAENGPRRADVRKTDLSADLARNRYRTFKEVTYESLTSLREVFHYHYVNAQQSIEAVQQAIVRELKYQSSLELDQSTYALIDRIPVAQSIIVHARQALVERLDQYARADADLFRHIVELVNEKFVPIVRRHAISGRAYVSSEDPIFRNPDALAMVIDVFSERGYRAAIDIRKEEIPDRFDLDTGSIITRRKRVYRFNISFEGSVIRRGH